MKLDNKYILLDVLMCIIAEYFYELCRILTRPTGSPKYGTTRKNTQRYYTTKRLIRYIYIVDGFGSFWLVLLLFVGGFGWFHVLVIT